MIVVGEGTAELPGGPGHRAHAPKNQREGGLALGEIGDDALRLLCPSTSGSCGRSEFWLASKLVGGVGMRLVRAQATNYRNIIDSGQVEIGSVTCLVGKNEAGKTAFLKALEGLRSVDPSFTEYGKTENYPRRFLSEYAERHGGKAARVITTEWEIDDDDVAAVEARLGPGTVNSRALKVWKTYDSEVSTWLVPTDNRKVLDALYQKTKLTGPEIVALAEVSSTK
jgi:hypothetical protein